jgi:hypothetical protein
VTDSRTGLSLRSNDGFDAAFFRDDGSMRVHVADTSVTISLSSRTAHPGHISIALDYLIRTLGAKTKDDLRFQVNGASMAPTFAEDRAVIATQTEASAEQSIEITRSRQ